MKSFPDAKLTQAEVRLDPNGGLVGVLNGQTYRVKLVKDGADLEKDGKVIYVRKRGLYYGCTCQDFLRRRGPSGTMCKHGLYTSRLGIVR